MRTLSIKTNLNQIGEALAECRKIAPQLLIVFGTPSAFGQEGFARHFAGMKDTHVMGCSTAGEIANDGVFNSSLSLMAIRFEHTQCRLAAASLQDASASADAGTKLARTLMDADLKGVFVLSPGMNVNGSDLVRGLASALPKDVVITGGLAGDDGAFKETYTLFNGHVSPSQVVAFGLYGDKVRIGCGSEGGWKPFGPARRVTRAEGNVLYELDGKPALALYKEYLGEKASGLPFSGLFYPFGILRDDNQKQIKLIRTILNVDHDRQSLILAGDMPQGARICLMHADTDSLIGGAQNAAGSAHIENRQGDAALLLVSCVGRKLIMGADIDEEVDAVTGALGRAAVSGFYSYGEIAPLGSGAAELHNQTMTVTHISEAV